MSSLSFLLVTALPTGLLALGALFGGVWAILALAYLTLINQAVDAVFAANHSKGATVLRTALPLCLGVAHFGLLALAVWSIAVAPHALWTKFALFIAFGLYFGSVSNGVAHELIHRTARLPFTLGKWIFISHLFGHHTSAHRLIHHPFVATQFDPNSARLGESFYKFFVRAWKGSFSAGLAAENTRHGLSADTRLVRPGHPYFTYFLGAALFAALAAAGAGVPGLITYLGLAFMAQTGLLLTDYIQHYGLTRAEGPDGKLEPVGPDHSWNASHWFTRNLTLNAPLHSAHHAKPAQTFDELENFAGAPQLPYSPGRMTLMALNPRRWRKVMNPLVAQHTLQSPAKA